MSEVPITLDGDEVQLRCTPGAMRSLCRKHGDLDACLQGVRRLNPFVMGDVVEAGLGPKGLKERKASREELDNELWKEGYVELALPLTKYLLMLANGGKEPKEDGGSGDETEDDAPNRE